jgi:predicted nucleic acid-binding Zn ribbon protein
MKEIKDDVMICVMCGKEVPYEKNTNLCTECEKVLEEQRKIYEYFSQFDR